MKLLNLRRIDGRLLTNNILDYLNDNGTDLTLEQRKLIAIYLEYKSHHIYEYKKTKKVKFRYRITLPVFFIVLVCMYLYMPIKWIFTGSMYYEPSDKIIIVKWARKLGI